MSKDPYNEDSYKLASLDPYKLAALRRTLEGQCAVASMLRATKLLPADAPQRELDYRLSFTLDEDKLCVIAGELSGGLLMCCQRCLQPFTYTIKCEFAVSPVPDDNAAKLLPSYYEPVMIVNSKLDLLELLEDELILALPQVPMHDVKECTAAPKQVASEPGEQELNHPFQILQKLKLKKNGEDI